MTKYETLYQEEVAETFPERFGENIMKRLPQFVRSRISTHCPGLVSDEGYIADDKEAIVREEIRGAIIDLCTSS